ncbi:dyslexia-associated protein KIAA0319-like isoform X3 [Gadus macrocephalus]|uniref:dyslexia-associated protein KIAA0319-like isoform X3 n=1 Tax=Gadus macrocephalus TaxID=80720 RepID=UPI0028CBB35E|nr:dyslexia-associated protein KIAA0319-like isoform X3 [Gadus macrocephalus]
MAAARRRSIIPSARGAACLSAPASCNGPADPACSRDSNPHPAAPGLADCATHTNKHTRGVVAMTPSALLLWMLLQSVGAAAAAPSQCHQGATIPEAVLAPALSSGSSVLRVPGVASLARCRVSCCERPRCDLAWLFQGRCYILSCQQGGACRPQNRPGADSYLAFVLRGPAQTLVLGPLGRGEPYGSRWGPPPSPPSSSSSSAPGDLEALRDLAVLEGEEGPPTRGGGVGGDLEPGGFSHWPAAEIEDRGEGPVTVNGSAGGPPSPGALRGQLGEQSPTFHPAESREPSPPTAPVIPSPWKPTTYPTQKSHIRTSLPTEATPLLSVTTATPTTTVSTGDPVECAKPVVTDQVHAPISPVPPAGKTHNNTRSNTCVHNQRNSV